MLDVGVSVDVRVGDGPAQELDKLRPILAELKELGFTHAEIGSNGLGVIIGGKLQPSRLALLQEALVDKPLRLTMHATWVDTGRLGNLADITTPAQHAAVQADLALAGAIGAEVLVYHSGMLRDPLGDDDAVTAAMKAEREHLRTLGDDAGQHGVLIAVENLNPTHEIISRRAYGLSLSALAEQIAAVDHPQVGICLDTGHAFLASRYLGFDFIDAVREISPLVDHIHLTDNLGRVGLADAGLNERYATGDGDLHLPPGWGEIPLEDFFSVPFPKEPTVILEMRSHFARHYAEALEATRELLGLAGDGMTAIGRDGRQVANKQDENKGVPIPTS